MTDDAQETRLLRREVDNNLVQARRALSEYQQAAADGAVDGELRSILRNAAIQLYNTFSQWRTDPQVKDTWQEQNLDQFGQLLKQRKQTTDPSHARLSSPGEQRQRLAVSDLQPAQFAAAIDGLTEVAKDLGFAPETTDRTVLEKGTLEDIRWLVNTRDQDKAVEELTPPNNDPEKITDGGVVAQSADAAGPAPDAVAGAEQRYPFRGPFFQLIAERKAQGRDAKIAVASANAATGVGKSTCAYYLAHVLDTSTDGFDVEQKATLNVDDFLAGYNELPKGSSLILDEAEQLTGRRAMSSQNVKAGERWQMCRVQEICSLLTLPKFSVLDSLMRDLVDFRVEIERRGMAVIYKKSHSPFRDTWWQAIQRFEYPSMDETRGMETLHDLKDEFIDKDSAGEGAVMSASEARKETEKAEKQARREERNRMVRRLSEAGMTQQDISDALEDEYGEDSDLAVSRRQIGNLLEDME